MKHHETFWGPRIINRSYLAGGQWGPQIRGIHSQSDQGLGAFLVVVNVKCLCQEDHLRISFIRAFEEQDQDARIARDLNPHDSMTGR